MGCLKGRQLNWTIGSIAFMDDIPLLFSTSWPPVLSCLLNPQPHLRTSFFYLEFHICSSWLGRLDILNLRFSSRGRHLEIDMHTQPNTNSNQIQPFASPSKAVRWIVSSITLLAMCLQTFIFLRLLRPQYLIPRMIAPTAGNER